MGARRKHIHRNRDNLATPPAVTLLALSAFLSGCATAPYQKSLTYRAQLAVFADCALSSLEREDSVGPRFSKADLPSTGEIRLTRTVQDAPYVTVTIRRVDASQVAVNIDVLPTLIMRESLRDQAMVALDRCTPRS